VRPLSRSSALSAHSGKRSPASCASRLAVRTLPVILKRSTNSRAERDRERSVLRQLERPRLGAQSDCSERCIAVAVASADGARPV
jgi:hypothetical protein